jgi:sulfatase maturation enzyme AslB (radical SAM superfamily)
MKLEEQGCPSLAHISKTLRQLSFPTRFAVEVTAECNLACSMCHHPDMRRPKGRMPFELWKKCADQISAISPESQCWFSFCGEPLLEPELIFKMLTYGKSVGLRSLNVNTNGMPLTPELANEQLKLPLVATFASILIRSICLNTRFLMVQIWSLFLRKRRRKA